MAHRSFFLVLSLVACSGADPTGRLGSDPSSDGAGSGDASDDGSGDSATGGDDALQPQAPECTMPAAGPGLPALPRTFVDTRMPTVSGNVLAVRAGEDLQTALDLAQPGDVVELEAGATFTGNFVLPNKGGEGWIIVRSAAHASLPPQGTRVGPAHAELMALLRTTNASPALRTAAGAHHWRLVGLEIATAHATRASAFTQLVELGTATQSSLASLPHHLIFDRCYLHGTPTGNIRRGIALNSAHTAVLDSHLSDFHEVGNDSQAICGWNGPGPFAIINNYLEGAGENFMLGGGDPDIAGLIPADVVFRKNHLVKPMSWRIDDPSYAGIPWTVKNIFELKNAERVLIDGNTMENNWAHAQNGYSVLLTPRNQENSAPHTAVRDITFTNNVVRNVANGMNILSIDEYRVSQPVERVLVKNNLFFVDAVLGGGTAWQHLTRSGAARDIVIERNTAIHAGGGPGFMRTGYCCHVTVDRWRFGGNIATLATNGLYGDDRTSGLGVLESYFTNWSFEQNVLVSRNAGDYPAGNHHVATLEDVGFVDVARGDFRLAPSSPYRGIAGADPEVIAAAASCRFTN